jgi:X-X-X-Leu-X-X-Gly heptad repeat protein
MKMKFKFKYKAAMAAAMAIAFIIISTGAASAEASAVTTEGESAPAAENRQAAVIKGKDEVVYANLTAGGDVSALHVVNRFDIAEAGSVTDYGDYDSVVNLTDLAPLAAADGEVAFEAQKGSFYYQGNKKAANLPWLFDITYSLDGAEVPPQELAGKNGKLEIHISTAKNADADPVFYDNYLLQLSLTLDGDRCADIESPGATIASAGKDTVVTHSILPGKDADILITASVSDFIMTGVEITALPFSMDFDPPDTSDMIDDLGELTDAIADLNEGVGDLLDGVNDYKTGAGKLKSGSADIKKGISKLNDNAAPLTAASARLQAELKTVSDGLTAVAGSFPEGMPGASDIQKLAGGLAQLSASYTQLDKGLAAYMEGVDAMDDGYKDFHSGLSSFTGGAADLADGVKKLRKGTAQLEDETADLPETAQSEIDAMLDEYKAADFERVSFVSPKNTDVGLVQFVIKCEGVEEPEKAASDAAEPENASVWDRFLALFTDKK